MKPHAHMLLNLASSNILPVLQVLGYLIVQMDKKAVAKHGEEQHKVP